MKTALQVTPFIIFVALDPLMHVVVVKKLTKQYKMFYVETGVIHPAVLVDLVDVVPLAGGVPPADGDKYLHMSRHGAL